MRYNVIKLYWLNFNFQNEEQLNTNDLVRFNIIEFYWWILTIIIICHSFTNNKLDVCVIKGRWPLKLDENLILVLLNSDRGQMVKGGDGIYVIMSCPCTIYMEIICNQYKKAC